MNLYNEISAYPAQWLQNLVMAGELPLGEVSTSSVAHLNWAVVKAYTQFHTFAGIGIWARALREAGWPDDAEVWTGSCPCQPFSTAGRKKGFSDDRHLWPVWFQLIEQCRPPVIFGEQVASPDGRAWFGTVRADLERAGYSVAAADLCAAGVGAPHIRQRLYFVAVADGERLERVRVQLQQRRSQPAGAETCGSRTTDSAGRLANTSQEGHQGRQPVAGTDQRLPEQNGLADDTGGREWLGDPSHSGSGRHARAVPRTQGESDRERVDTRRVVDVPEYASAGLVRGRWAESGIEWLACQDGKARPVEPGLEPLVDGNSAELGFARAARCAGYGNAICLPLAVTFVESVIDILVSRGA